MALVHRVSDVINMRIDKDAKGYPVIELELRFIRYRLVIDDQKKGERLLGFLKGILEWKGDDEEVEKVERPKFYKSGR